MTVQELIEDLQKIENKDLEVLNDNGWFINTVYIDEFENSQEYIESYCVVSSKEL